MARSTGKDHARINLDIWGDDDWLDLSPPAQHLYFVLWTSPLLSYCGTGDWAPAKIAAKARGWTAEDVIEAAIELSHELFMVIDTETGEFILRSWMKHDGLWRTPNMAVSMANARADLASRTLRGVVVFEVLKLKKRNPKSSSWDRDAVSAMLTQKAIDPATLEPFEPDPTPALTAAATLGLTVPPMVAPTLNATVGVNPTANGASNSAATPTPPTPPTPEGGYVSRERHQSDEPDSNAPPSRFCPQHPNGDSGGKACRGCGDAGQRLRDWTESRANQRRLEIAACPSCDPHGWLLNDDGSPADRQVRCPAHEWETAHA